MSGSQSKVSKENLLLVEEFSIVFKFGPDIDHMWAEKDLLALISANQNSWWKTAWNQLQYFNQLLKGQIQLIPSLCECH